MKLHNLHKKLDEQFNFGFVNRSLGLLPKATNKLDSINAGVTNSRLFRHGIGADTYGRVNNYLGNIGENIEESALNLADEYDSDRVYTGIKNYQQIKNAARRKMGLGKKIALAGGGALALGLLAKNNKLNTNTIKTLGKSTVVGKGDTMFQKLKSGGVSKSLIQSGRDIKSSAKNVKNIWKSNNSGSVPGKVWDTVKGGAKLVGNTVSAANPWTHANNAVFKYGAHEAGVRGELDHVQRYVPIGIAAAGAYGAAGTVKNIIKGRGKTYQSGIYRVEPELIYIIDIVDKDNFQLVGNTKGYNSFEEAREGIKTLATKPQGELKMAKGSQLMTINPVRIKRTIK